MPDFQKIRHILPELENGENVEQYRLWRHSTNPNAGALKVPQEIQRVYRGVWGNSTLAAPLVGSHLAHEDHVAGVQDSAAYIPIWYRGEVRIDHRRLFRADAWNVYLNHAVFESVPSTQGRRSKKPLWCLLLAHELTPKTREHFWINPLDDRWDGTSELTTGRTFYANHFPISVKVCFVRLDLLKGVLKKRRLAAMSKLKGTMRAVLPVDEWRPEKREPRTKPRPAPRKHKLRYPKRAPSA